MARQIEAVRYLRASIDKAEADMVVADTKRKQVNWAIRLHQMSTETDEGDDARRRAGEYGLPVWEAAHLISECIELLRQSTAHLHELNVLKRTERALTHFTSVHSKQLFCY